MKRLEHGRVQAADEIAHHTIAVFVSFHACRRMSRPANDVSARNPPVHFSNLFISSSPIGSDYARDPGLVRRPSFWADEVSRVARASLGIHRTLQRFPCKQHKLCQRVIGVSRIIGRGLVATDQFESNLERIVAALRTQLGAAFQQHAAEIAERTAAERETAIRQAAEAARKEIPGTA